MLGFGWSCDGSTNCFTLMFCCLDLAGPVMALLIVSLRCLDLAGPVMALLIVSLRCLALAGPVMALLIVSL